MEERSCMTPLNDLRESALKHYDEAASSIHHYSSTVPRAINYYFDAQIRKQEVERIAKKVQPIIIFIGLLLISTIGYLFFK